MKNEVIALIVVFILMISAIFFLSGKIRNKDVNSQKSSLKTKKIFLWIVGIVFIFFAFSKIRGCYYKKIEEEKEATRREVYVAIWKFNSYGDSTIYIRSLTPIRVKLNFQYRITPECGRSIMIKNQSWSHQMILRGCENGTSNFPNHRWGSDFLITKLE